MQWGPWGVGCPSTIGQDSLKRSSGPGLHDATPCRQHLVQGVDEIIGNVVGDIIIVADAGRNRHSNQLRFVEKADSDSGAATSPHAKCFSERLGPEAFVPPQVAGMNLNG